MKKATRLVIADDRLRTRHGLRAVLATVPGVEVIGEASSGKEMVELVKTSHPDVVLIDRCTQINGDMEATRQIRDLWPEVKVIVISLYASKQEEAFASEAGVCLVKGGSVEDLLKAVSGPDSFKRPKGGPF